MSTSEKSIAAYENEARVASYDADMEIMHPNRHRMADIIVEVLSASAREPKVVVDLGTGTGFLLERLLSRFAELRAIAVDGAQSMTALAKARLKDSAKRVDFRVSDFRRLADTCADVRSADAVVSTFGSPPVLWTGKMRQNGYERHVHRNQKSEAKEFHA